MTTAKASIIAGCLSACTFIAALRFMQHRHAAAHDRCGEELDEQAQTRAAGLGELVREQLPAGIAAELQYIRETLRTFCAQNANVNDQLLRVEASLDTLACMIGAALHQARKDGSQLRVGTRHLRSVEESPVTIGTTAWLATLGGTVERGQLMLSDHNDGRTLLHACSLNDRVHAARLLLEAGAHPDRRGPNGIGPTPLHVCSSCNSVHVAKLLINAGADIDAPLDLDWLHNVLVAGATPLHTCSCFGSGGVAKLLLDAGADKNATDDLGATPLMVCRKTGSVDVAKLLAEAGANF